MILEEQVKSSGEKYEKIAEDIFLIKNFISEEEQKKILLFAENADWTEVGKNNLLEHAIEMHGSKDIEYLISNNYMEKPEMFDKIISLTKDPSLFEKAFVRLGKLAPTNCLAHSFEYLQRHTDNSGLSAHRDEFDGIKIRYGAIVYLQHGEIGGEIYFHPLNLTVLPPERSLLLFNGQYLHEVRPVYGEKTRYAMPSYIYEI